MSIESDVLPCLLPESVISLIFLCDEYLINWILIILWQGLGFIRKGSYES